MAQWNRVVILAGLLAASQAMGQEVLRESVGTRAIELGQMELKPFDTKAWSTLEDWTNGSALDSSATDGKVVLIATLASWNPASTRVISSLQSLKTKYGDQGLIVVGVHHAQGWDAAPEMMSKRKADFLLAHDTNGKFREAIKADQDPDFYLIDRAGQLRFADIRTESVEEAVKQLVAEDATAAGGVAARIASEAQQREAEASRPRTIQDKIDMRSLPEVPFLAPPPEIYQIAAWPERKKDDSGNNQDQGPLTRPVPGAGWIGGDAPKTTGRAVVYYAWRLDDTRSSDVVRDMDQLQRRLGRDVVVVGVLIGVRGDDNGRSNEGVDPAELIRRAERMRRTLGLEQAMLLDIGGQFFNSNSNNGSNEGYPAVVVSSDNTERWAGVVTDNGMRAALDRVTNVDPGIRARRAAEEAYLRAQGG
ncbi:MAG: TlpA family protein disulfide reductase [Phycisphaerales bacterium]|nr:TlpA family protein disulfide reductase [Phycisphaerales bacterium]